MGSVHEGTFLHQHDVELVPLNSDGLVQPMGSSKIRHETPVGIPSDTAKDVKQRLKKAAITKSESIWYWYAAAGSLLAASGLVVMICTLSLGKTIESANYTALSYSGVNANIWDLLLAYSIATMCTGLGILFARVMVFWQPITAAIQLSYVNGFRWILAFVRENLNTLVLSCLSGANDWVIVILLMMQQTNQVTHHHSNERDNSNYHHAAKEGFREHRKNPQAALSLPASHYFSHSYALFTMAGKWAILGLYWGEKLRSLPVASTHFGVLLFIGLVSLVVEVILALLFTIRYMRSYEYCPVVLRKRSFFEKLYMSIVTVRDLSVIWALFYFAVVDPMYV